MREYIEVLDRQSNRLKKLIEDLMEASKASTGNLPVNPEVCDATVVLTQIVGEFSEKAEANQLEMVVECPQPPVEIYVDGRHLWRCSFDRYSTEGNGLQKVIIRIRSIQKK